VAVVTLPYELSGSKQLALATGYKLGLLKISLKALQSQSHTSSPFPILTCLVPHDMVKWLLQIVRL